MRSPILAATLASMLVLSACAADKTAPKAANQPAPNSAKPTLPTADTGNYSRPQSNLAQRADVQNFIQKASREHNLNPEWMRKILNHTNLQPKIIEAMNRPAEGVMNWGRYRPIFMTEKRINDGVNFFNQHRTTFERAEAQYGVDKYVIAAIIGVETSYGQNRGSWLVLDALATLAFDYPRRAEFFSKELGNFFKILSETGRDPFSYKGSYAGAMGYPQFMPSSYLAYAVDFDGDGHRDLWNNPVDAIGSVANYLAKHGWVRGAKVAEKVSVSPNTTAYHSLKHSGRLTPPKHSLAQLRDAGVITPNHAPGPATLFQMELTSSPKVDEWWLGYRNFYAITRYNHSPLYAMAVYQLAEAIKARN